MCKVRAGARAATCTLTRCSATGGAACATECAATHSAQSWSACAVAWKCAACAIPLIRTSAMQTIPKMTRYRETALGIPVRMLFIR